MKLNKLEIQGFKSFYDYQALTFKPGITAIVGPNGCGKSNISDAISWVLGSQSAINLRGRRMDDLIFNGSRNRKPLGMAQVIIRIATAGPHDRKAGDNGVIEIGRRLFRTGESEYLLNGRPCRLRDIQEVTMDTGLGTSVYTVIEQGKIDKILSTNAQERRELIEEAAGITRFKAKRHQTDLKLQATQANLTRLSDVMMEIDKQIKSLARQAGKARQYRRLREEASDLQLLIYIDEYFTYFKKQEEVLRRLASMKDHETRSSTALGSYESETEELKLQLIEKEETFNKLKDEVFNCEINLNNLEARSKENKTRSVELNVLIEKNRDKVDELGKRKSERLAEREEEETFLKELEQSVLTKKDALREKNSKLAAHKKIYSEIEQEWEESGKKQISVMNKSAEVRSLLVKVKGEFERERMRRERSSAELKELINEQNQISSELKQGSGDFESVSGEIGTLRSGKADIEGKVSALKEEMIQKSEDLSRLREGITRLSSEIETIRKMQWSDPGRFSGGGYLLDLQSGGKTNLQGTLLDYLTVDEQYRRAVERYLEERIRYFIVPDISDAIELANELKAKKEGRAAFLIRSILEKQSPFPSLQKMDDDAVVTNLHSVLQGRGDFAHLVTRLVPDAFIVKNGLVPQFLAKLEKKADVITMEGDLLLRGGAFISGSADGNAKGILDLQAEIRSKEMELKKLQSSQTDLSNDEVKLSKKIEYLEEERKELDIRLSEAERRYSVLEEKIKRLSEEKSRLATKKELLEGEKKQISKEEEVLTIERKRLEEEEAKIEKEKHDILDYRESIKKKLEAEKENLEVSGENHTKLQLEVNEIEAEKHKRESRLTHLGESVADIESRIREREIESEDAAKKLEALALEIKEFEGEIDSKKTTLFDLRKKLEEQERNFKNSQGALFEKEQNLKTVRKQHEEEIQMINRLEVELAEHSANLKHIEDSCKREMGRVIQDFTPLFQPDELEKRKSELIEQHIKVKEKLASLGEVNLTAFEEYEKQKERMEFYRQQENDLQESISSLQKVITKIEKESRRRFQEAFERIADNFKEIFARLFEGGRARLSLPEGEDVLECQINISAQPPGKRLQNINLLSGGEKAMTAIALLFSIFRYKPSPFCLLDEVDSPLDEVNVGRFVKMVNEYSDNTQFILVTHNKRTMEMADILYGVTMEEPGLSKLVSVSFIEEADSLSVAK